MSVIFSHTAATIIHATTTRTAMVVDHPYVTEYLLIASGRLTSSSAMLKLMYVFPINLCGMALKGRYW